MANNLLERQVVGFLCRNPDKGSSFPNLDNYLTDSQARILYKIFKNNPEVGINPVIISQLMTGFGIKVSADQVKDDLIRYSDPDLLPDASSAFAMLQKISQDGLVIASGRDALNKLETGKYTRQEYFKEITEKYSKYGDIFTRNSMDSRTWAKLGPVRAEFYRDMKESGLMLYMPRMWPTIRGSIGPLIFGTVIVIIGASGGGKSIAAEQLAYEWAIECDHNVLFANTELTNDQEMWRYILKYYPMSLKTPTVQDFQEGYWDATCDKLMEKFANSKGSIRFIESSGATAEDIVAAAASIDGHIVVDYADMLYKDPKINETLAVADMMTTFKRYAQTYGRVVLVVQQVTKQATYEMKRFVSSNTDQSLEGESAMGSARFLQRSNLMLSTNFSKCEEITNIKNPITGEIYKLAVGDNNPSGYIKNIKSTFGRGGKRWNMFLDGANFRMVEYGN